MLLPSFIWIVLILLSIPLVVARSDREFNERATEEFLAEVPDSVDAKDHFFRYVRAYGTGELSSDQISLQPKTELPRPGGFKLPYLDRFRRNIQLDNEHVIDYYDISDGGDIKFSPRYVRAVNDKVKIEATHVNIEEALGKPLEIGIIEANINVTTEQTFDKDPEDVSTSSAIPRIVIPKGKALVINDFIRFRRDVKPQNQKTVKSSDDQVEEFNPSKGISTSLRTKRERQTAPDGMSRESRGATTEQWIKQPYPIIHPPPGDSRYEDTMTSATGSLESIARAPRVNFVTQRRSSHDGYGTSLPPLLYRSPDRAVVDDYYYYNGASRPREGKMWQDMQRPAVASNDVYYQSRPNRYPDQQYYEDPYYYDTRDRRYYDPNKRYYDMQDRYQSLPSQAPPPINRQRRIIYYTTLPEVVRSPPSVDMREKFNKYGGYGGDQRYDSRYVTSSPLSVAGLPPHPDHYHHYRPSSMLPYPDRHLQKPRSPYGSTDEGKGLPPGIKVSSDDVVSVHELKKNPERRIYVGEGRGSSGAPNDPVRPLGPGYANQEATFRRGSH